MNPYTNIPVYETKNLQLRLIRMEDASDLLQCYSDLDAVARMNADGCIGTFYSTMPQQMSEAIALWLSAYGKQEFVRLSVIPKELGKAAGTVEMFGTDDPELGRVGILRMDLASKYETPQIISELTALAVSSFRLDFEVDTIFMKALHTPERAKVLMEYGFSENETFRPGLGYYGYQNKEIAD